jgi:hypothetical protein
MSELRYTLLTEGSSDVVLLSHITWLMKRHTTIPIRPQFAALGQYRHPPRGLARKIEAALEFYACDILFVHRDADTFSYEHRQQEIHRAAQWVQYARPPVICVIPVRMQEAWLLFDESAIRSAAGRPAGRMALNLPPLRSVESLANPKARLHDTLRLASGFQGRRLENFNIQAAVRRLAELLKDFSLLLTDHLPAFKRLDADIAQIVSEHGW